MSNLENDWVVRPLFFDALCGGNLRIGREGFDETLPLGPDPDETQKFVTRVARIFFETAK